MKKLLIFLLLLIASPAWAAYFVRTDCGDITGPVEGDVCSQTSTVSGRTSGHLYIYRSAAWADVDTLGGSGAPADATYITQTANGGLSAEQALGSLATGILKNTTTTGVLSIATEGTDYYKPGGTDVAVADGGTGRSTLTNHGVVIGAGTTGVSVTGTGSAGQVLTSNGASADPTFQTLAGSGTVTSVDGAATGIFSITGGPITGSGTLTLGQTGTSGGIPFFSSSSALTSSGVLGASQLVLGGGSGSTPTSLGSLGTSTTVLHGNAAGAPSFSAVSLLTDTTGTLPVASGGTNLTTATDDNVMVGNGTTWQTKAVPDCDDSGGNHLNYDTTTNTFVCGTSAGGAASVAFSGITGATNTSAAMVVGTGASLAVSGSGTIAATTATALAADPTDCAADTYANAIVASGNLTCAGVTGAQVSNTPAGNIAASTAQTAIDELESEKPYATASTSAPAPGATAHGTLHFHVDTDETPKKLYFGSGAATDMIPVGDLSDTINTVSDSVTAVDCTGSCTQIFTSAGLISVGTPVAASMPNGTITVPLTTSIATSRLAGRTTASTGPLEAITVSTGLTLASTDLKITDHVKSVYFPAGALSTDGTQCATPAEVTINSGSKRYTIICADNDASTIYGETEMPDSWAGGTVTLAGSFIQTAADTNAMNSDVAMACRASGDTINNTWGTEIAMDITNMGGSNKIDKVTTAAITPNGTCTGGGKLLQFRWQLDAGGTTTAVATLHVLGFKLEYTVTGAGSD